jgi:hypothetical protein
VHMHRWETSEMTTESLNHSFPIPRLALPLQNTAAQAM